MRLPEPSVDCSELGKLRREIGSGMQLRVWKMSPDEAQGVEAIQERHHRPAGGEAEPTPEVPVLDQRQPGRVGAGDMIAVSDRGQCAGGRGGHPVYVTQRSRDISCLGAVEKRVDVVGEQFRVLVEEAVTLRGGVGRS